jgi:hypothetical protein
MKICYDEVTKRVTGIVVVGEVLKSSFIELEDFIFEFPFIEYEVKDGIPIHKGKSQEHVDQENMIKMLELSSGVQNLLDSKARELRYDNIMSARSYAGYENPFQTEALSLAVWASECWIKVGEIEAEVTAGIRAFPTLKQFMLELPVYDGY